MRKLFTFYTDIGHLFNFFINNFAGILFFNYFSFTKEFHLIFLIAYIDEKHQISEN